MIDFNNMELLTILKIFLYVFYAVMVLVMLYFLQYVATIYEIRTWSGYQAFGKQRFLYYNLTKKTHCQEYKDGKTDYGNNIQMQEILRPYKEKLQEDELRVYTIHTPRPSGCSSAETLDINDATEGIYVMPE